MSILLAKTAGLASLAGLAVTLAACGGTDPAAAEADAAAKAETARVRLEQCLRENGMDVKSESGGRRTFIRGNDVTARKAMEKCRTYQQAAFDSITPKQRQEFQDAATRFAACMRSHGVDLPDPATSTGGPGGGPQTRRSTGRGSGVRIDRESPTTRAAMEACRDKLPRGGAGGIRMAAPIGTS